MIKDQELLEQKNIVNVTRKRKPRYRFVVYYGEEFLKTMEEFERLIILDKIISKEPIKNDNQRRSVAIRYLIRKYLESRRGK